MDKPYILYGASGHGAVILDILEATQQPLVAFVDDNPSLDLFEDYPVWRSEKLITESEAHQLIISIGNNVIRKKIAESLSMAFGTAIHPSAVISRKSSVGAGSVVMPHTTINARTKIGAHVIINTNASVDHDCRIEDYVHISPNATLCGNVQIGEGSHIGAGATIIPGITIGKWCKIGAGAVVIKDVADNLTCVGNPAIKFF